MKLVAWRQLTGGNQPWIEILYTAFDYEEFIYIYVCINLNIKLRNGIYIFHYEEFIYMYTNLNIKLRNNIYI